MLPPGGAAAPAVAHNHRRPGQAAQDAAPNVGYHGKEHQQIRRLAVQAAPEIHQGQGADRGLPGQPDHRDGPFPGQRRQIVPGGHHPDLDPEPGGIKTPGQFQGLALGAAEFQILEEKDQAGRASSGGRA